MNSSRFDEQPAGVPGEVPHRVPGEGGVRRRRRTCMVLDSSVAVILTSSEEPWTYPKGWEIMTRELGIMKRRPLVPAARMRAAARRGDLCSVRRFRYLLCRRAISCHYQKVARE